MIFVSASSTPSTTARHSDSGNPRCSASCNSAPRTTHSVSGLLRNSIFRSKLGRFNGAFSSGSGSRTCYEVVVSQFCRFFGKIERGPQVSAEEPHFAVQILLQDILPGLVVELAMNIDRSLPRHCGHIARHFAALLESPHR